jgi:hypothetical protein
VNIKKTLIDMTNALINTPQTTPKFKVDPLLTKVFREAEQEHKNLQNMFSTLGWGNLPDELKLEIKDDVLAMVNELKGQYSTCDPYVLKRRESVTYWVNAFQDDICSLQTAIDALKVTKL